MCTVVAFSLTMFSMCIKGADSSVRIHAATVLSHMKRVEKFEEFVTVLRDVTPNHRNTLV